MLVVHAPWFTNGKGKCGSTRQLSGLRRPRSPQQPPLQGGASVQFCPLCPLRRAARSDAGSAERPPAQSFLETLPACGPILRAGERCSVPLGVMGQPGDEATADFLNLS